MRTYVKVEGDKSPEIVQKLARLAVNAPEVCVMDSTIEESGWSSFYPNYTVETTDKASAYFGMERSAFARNCDRIISKSGADLGDADIYFEWHKKPTDDQLKVLKGKVDDIIKPYGAKYRVWDQE